MTRAMRTAASGMLAQQFQVDTLANNISNVNTAGFKRNRVNFRALLYSTMREPGSATGANQINPTGLQVGSGTEISSSVKVFAQGPLEQTGADLDISVQGEGFFQINLGNGEFRYTRDGSFRQDANGDLVTVDGFRLDPGISINPNASQITIGQDGTVTQFVAGVPSNAGVIQLVRFANPAGLRAEGSNFFSETLSSGPATLGAAGQAGYGFVRQGFLERSNTSIVEELIALIQAQRNYEINSRTIQVSDEMMQQTTSLI